MKPCDRLIVALDVDTEAFALELVRKLKSATRRYKVGLELFTSCGGGIVGKVKAEGCDVFLDLKLHDIPTTVARAASVVTALGAFMINVHALGGLAMMAAAAKAVREKATLLGATPPKVIAVTVLTSMDDAALAKAGIAGPARDAAVRLALLAREAGLDGVVASPAEIKAIRKAAGKDFLIVTPGVRPAWAVTNDQKRIATPHEAIADGADYIVVGRPITAAPDPAAAAERIVEEMES